MTRFKILPAVQCFTILTTCGLASDNFLSSLSSQLHNIIRCNRHFNLCDLRGQLRTEQQPEDSDGCQFLTNLNLRLQGGCAEDITLNPHGLSASGLEAIATSSGEEIFSLCVRRMDVDTGREADYRLAVSG